ncbi:MAG: homocysteine S-methyltransferase family protein [Syntrophomonadaceae bacterium]|nr:homocysteine S-methyltransferase family protein [Syntrophomonadaceae bacterium]
MIVLARDLESLLKERVVILDGAMGTLLQRCGLLPGQCPELFGIERPEALLDIHRAYVEAGSDIIQSNTFGGNACKLAEYGLAERAAEINAELVRIARRAAGDKAMVAASIGPTGRLLPPMGDADFDTLYTAFAEQMRGCEAAGADLISIETMTDIAEMRIALIAARQATRLPVIAHMTFENGGRTMTGTDPLTAMYVMEALRPLALGANCSGGAQELLPIIEQMYRHGSNYLSVEPNAGLPRLIGDETVFPDEPELMAQYALRLKEAGANIIGACCGSTPEHIQAMATVLRGLKAQERGREHAPALCSRSRSVVLDSPGAHFIGERLNPTARKMLAQAIRNGDMEVLVREGRRQAECGAEVLDVNVGVPGIHEAAAMETAITALQNALDIPLCIDSTDPVVIEAALKAYVGRPLINSTTGEEKQLSSILPLAKRYGAAVLGLCITEDGIPAPAAERYAAAEHIVARAEAEGLRRQDVLIDCLVKTASAEQALVMETIKAVGMVKTGLGVATVLGVSNVSHGLPARDILNSTYLTMALYNGLDLPILNPFDERMLDSVRACRVLMDSDRNALNYIAAYKDRAPAAASAAPAAQPAAASVPAPSDDIFSRLHHAVYQGNSDGIVSLLEQGLAGGEAPLDMVNRGLIPGIEAAGEAYERKQYFLPQLMMAAEAMKTAFAFIRPHLGEGGGYDAGTVILATVEGDIHDIGKNIVAVMMENYGFKVIDLGKDVPAAVILEAAQREQADIIGLSALMTTTMPRMKEVVAGVQARQLPSLVMVGGAVLNQEYADLIQADAYSSDARAAVVTAQKLMKQFMGGK